MLLPAVLRMHLTNLLPTWCRFSEITLSGALTPPKVHRFEEQAFRFFCSYLRRFISQWKGCQRPLHTDSIRWTGHVKQLSGAQMGPKDVAVNQNDMYLENVVLFLFRYAIRRTVNKQMNWTSWDAIPPLPRGTPKLAGYGACELLTLTFLKYRANGAIVDQLLTVQPRDGCYFWKSGINIAHSPPPHFTQSNDYSL